MYWMHFCSHISTYHIICFHKMKKYFKWTIFCFIDVWCQPWSSDVMKDVSLLRSFPCACVTFTLISMCMCHFYAHFEGCIFDRFSLKNNRFSVKDIECDERKSDSRYGNNSQKSALLRGKIWTYIGERSQTPLTKSGHGSIGSPMTYVILGYSDSL